MEVSIALINMGYAIFGAVLTLVFMAIGYFVFDKLTPFDTARQLSEKNMAVGVVVAAIFIGLGIAVGLTIGMGLN